MPATTAGPVRRIDHPASLRDRPRRHRRQVSRTPPFRRRNGSADPRMICPRVRLDWLAAIINSAADWPLLRRQRQAGAPLALRQSDHRVFCVLEHRLLTGVDAERAVCAPLPLDHVIARLADASARDLAEHPIAEKPIDSNQVECDHIRQVVPTVCHLAPHLDQVNEDDIQQALCKQIGMIDTVHSDASAIVGDDGRASSLLDQ